MNEIVRGWSDFKYGRRESLMERNCAGCSSSNEQTQTFKICIAEVLSSDKPDV